MGDLSKIIVAKGFKNTPIVQKIAKIWSHWSHTNVCEGKYYVHKWWLSSFSLRKSFPIKQKASRGGRHSSVVSSAPTILRPRVQIPSTPSMLFQFVLLKL